MADWKWPGHRITTLPFVDGSINTRYYDTLPKVEPGHDPTHDPDDVWANSVNIYDRQNWIQDRWTQFDGIYHVNYSIIGEGRPVYFRVVGESSPGVVLQVFRVATRDGRTSGAKIVSDGTDDEPQPLFGVRGWTGRDADPSDSGDSWHRTSAWRGILAAGKQYTIRISSYGSRGGNGLAAGQPGYDSGIGQVMLFEADYDYGFTETTDGGWQLTSNDLRKYATEVMIFDQDRPYISAPYLNTGYGTEDFDGIASRPEPALLLGLGYTAWWKYTPIKSGPARISVGFKDTEDFPGQWPHGILYAIRYTAPVYDKNNSDQLTTPEKFEFIASSRYNTPTGVPEATFVEIDVAKGEIIYIVVGTYLQFRSISQKYVLTVSGPQSKESLNLRLKTKPGTGDKKWETLSGGPYLSDGLFQIRADNRWYQQVGPEENNAVALALRMKDNKSWEDVLWFKPISDITRNGRSNWELTRVTGQFSGYAYPMGVADVRTTYLGYYNYAENADHTGMILLPPVLPVQPVQNTTHTSYDYTSESRSCVGWSSALGAGDYPVMVRYKSDQIGTYSLPLGMLLAASKDFFERNEIDAKLNRVEITHSLTGWSVDKSQMPWMNRYYFGETTNSLYSGVGALVQLPKQALNKYEKVTLDGAEYMAPVPSSRSHEREDGVVLWTGDLNDLGHGIMHGLTNKAPVKITQTLYSYFVGNYTASDVILYQLHTSPLPDPEAVRLDSDFYHTIENHMNADIGIRIIYEVPE